MKVSEVLDELNGGKTLEDLSKQLSVNSRKIGKALRSIGYSFDKSSKKWIYNDLSEQSFDKPIFDLISKTNQKEQSEDIDNMRNIVILPKRISEQFDSFASKMPFEKSDLLQLALINFMERYSAEGKH